MRTDGPFTIQRFDLLSSLQELDLTAFQVYHLKPESLFSVFPSLADALTHPTDRKRFRMVSILGAFILQPEGLGVLDYCNAREKCLTKFFQRFVDAKVSTQNLLLCDLTNNLSQWH